MRVEISKKEIEAIKLVLDAGAEYGYGDMIRHLKTAWARHLIDKYGMDEKLARISSGGEGYPFKLQNDLLADGVWDNTKETYI